MWALYLARVKNTMKYLYNEVVHINTMKYKYNEVVTSLTITQHGAGLWWEQTQFALPQMCIKAQLCEGTCKPSSQNKKGVTEIDLQNTQR